MPRMIYYYTKSKIEKALSNPDQLKREIKKASKTLLTYEMETLSIWLDRQNEVKNIENWLENLNSKDLKVS